MKTKKVFSGKRILALILALVMAISVMPVAFAAEPDYLNEPGQLISASGGWITKANYGRIFFSTNLNADTSGLNNDGSLNYTYVQMQDDDIFTLQLAFGAMGNQWGQYVRKEKGNYTFTGLPVSDFSWKITAGNAGDNAKDSWETQDSLLRWTGTAKFTPNGSAVYNGMVSVTFNTWTGGRLKIDNKTYTEEGTINITVIDKRPLLDAIRTGYEKQADADKYTESSYADFVSALAAAEAIAPAATVVTQEQVTQVTNALNDAIAALAYQGADYAALNAAKADAETILNDEKADETYTVDSLSALREKYDAAVAIQDGLDVSHQDEIDKAASELDAAVKALVKFANYAPLQAAVNAFHSSQLNPDWYNPEDYEPVKALADAAEEALKPENRLPASKENQATINAQALKLQQAMTALKAKMLPADYTALDAALTEGKAKLDMEKDYTPETIKTLEDAYLAGLKISQDKPYKKNNQSKVDAAEQAIRDAIAGLKFADAKYEKLNAAIAAAEVVIAGEDYTKGYFTDASVQALTAALEAARGIAPDLTVDKQYIIDNAVTALNTAVRSLELKPADYTDLKAAIAAREQELADARQSGKFTEASMARLETAIGVAKAVDPTYSIKEQSIVDDAVKTLNAVKLEKRAADTTKLEAAIDKAQNDLNKAGDEYTDESKAALSAAIKKAREVLAQYGGDVDNQEIINQAVIALESVKLQLKKADYTKFDAAVTEAEKFLADPETEKLYTPEAIQKVKDALEEAKNFNHNLTIDKQKLVDDATGALVNAMPGDSGYKDANLDALKAAIVAADEKLAAEDIADYTEESIAALRAARDDAQAMVDRKPSIKEQDDVDKKAEALNAMALTLKDADYTALEVAVEKATSEYAKAEASGLYTAVSLDQLMSAIISANALLDNRNLTIKEQKIVDDAVAALDVELVYRDADLTELIKAIATAEAKMAAPGYNEYTLASRQAFEALLAEAKVLRNSNPDITKQEDVIAAADKLNNFKLSLQSADYTDLDMFMEEAKALLGTNLSDKYTNASIDVMKAALVEAENIDRELDVSEQGYVDDIAQALRNAIDALESYNKVTGVQITQNGQVVDGDVAYVKVPWYKTYKSQSTTLSYQVSGDGVSVKWELANWSVDNPEADIIDNGDGTVTIRPNGKGIGARSCWVKVTVTDVNGNTVEDYVKVRFYNWEWQK